MLSTTSGTPILMDGGLGTTLEDIFNADISHPLWSARLIDRDEDVIVAAHLAFLRAGSQIILAATYQAAYETFRKAGYADVDAERLMHKAIKLAVKAREKYEDELGTHTASGTGIDPKVKIALSLGPYGATLDTAAEFTGVYPPPYGPPLSTPSPPGTGRVPIPSSEKSREDALASFHFTRLLVYASTPHVWDAIDLVAFETVPLITEARAIRRAVARLEDWFRQRMPAEGKRAGTTWIMKSWYISFVFPGLHGEFPQSCSTTDVSQLSDVAIGRSSMKLRPYLPYEVAQSAFELQPPGWQSMARPNAIGVNCTKMCELSRVVEGFAAAVSHMWFGSPNSLQSDLPWLVVCPNGGVAYDPIERVWLTDIPNSSTSSSQAEFESREEKWAKSLVSMMCTPSAHRSPRWDDAFGGLLVGGCCKTRPDEIKALREIINTLKRP